MGSGFSSYIIPAVRGIYHDMLQLNVGSLTTDKLGHTRESKVNLPFWDIPVNVATLRSNCATWNRDQSLTATSPSASPSGHPWGNPICVFEDLQSSWFTASATKPINITGNIIDFSCNFCTATKVTKEKWAWKSWEFVIYWFRTADVFPTDGFVTGGSIPRPPCLHKHHEIVGNMYILNTYSTYTVSHISYFPSYFIYPTMSNLYPWFQCSMAETSCLNERESWPVPVRMYRSATMILAAPQHRGEAECLGRRHGNDPYRFWKAIENGHW